MFREQLALGNGDAVARELHAWRSGDASLSKAAVMQARMLDGFGVDAAPFGGGYRLEEAGAWNGLLHFYGVVKQSLETQSVKACGKTLDDVTRGDEDALYDIHDQCFTTAINMLFATSRLGSDDGNRSVDASAFVDDGAALVRSQPGFAAKLRKSGYVVVDGALDAGAVAALRSDLETARNAGLIAPPDQQRQSGTRGDAYGWVNEDDAEKRGLGALAATIRKLKGLAAVLNAVGYHGSPLHVDENALGTRYPGAVDDDAAPYRGYRIHQDNAWKAASCIRDDLERFGVGKQ